MQVFRHKWLRWILTVLTAIIFLNMSFFLMEVKLLRLYEDKAVMESISRMLAGALCEEERDCSTQSPGQGFSEEEYILNRQAKSYPGCYFLISDHRSMAWNDGSIKYGFFKRFCPPPEINQSIVVS